jgi:hypothetical protein
MVRGSAFPGLGISELKPEVDNSSIHTAMTANKRCFTTFLPHGLFESRILFHIGWAIDEGIRPMWPGKQWVHYRAWNPDGQ